MDILVLSNWLTAIAFVCGFTAGALVFIIVFNWIAEWVEGWWNKKQYRKNNHAYPYNWNKNDWKDW